MIKPERRWTPEIDAILASDDTRISIVDMLALIRQIMPGMTYSAIKHRRARLRKGETTRKYSGSWDRTIFSDERTAYLKEVWETEAPFRLIWKRWNELPGGKTQEKQVYNHASRLGLYRPNGRGPRAAPKPEKPERVKRAGLYEGVEERVIERLIRRGSDKFGASIRAAGIVYDDHPDFAPRWAPRRGIMTGKPPDLDKMVADRVAAAEQSRLAVGEAYARRLEE